MAKKKIIDNKKLLKMISDGVSKKNILEHFGFNTSNQLKMGYLNALMELGKVPEIKSSRAKKVGEKIRVKVKKSGSLIIPKKIIENFKFKENDTFNVRKTKTGISLRIIEDKTK